MEEFRIDVPVACTDGDAGKVYALVLNPVTKTVTHIVVKADSHFHDIEKLVPVEHVRSAGHEQVTLDCSVAQFEALDSFIQTRYVESQQPDYLTMEAGAYMSPYTTDVAAAGFTETIETVPPGELAIHRGAAVQATDGHIGHVGEFVIDGASGHISHIVLEKGHLWAKREIAVPIDRVGTVEPDSVRLTLDKAAVEALPEPSLLRNYEKE